MNNLEKVFIISGACANFYTDKLEPAGEKQIINLLPIVWQKILANEVKTIVLSSRVSYNEVTASVIARRFSLPCEPNKVLGGPNVQQRSTSMVIDFIRARAYEQRATAVIVVVESKYVNQLANGFITEIGHTITEFQKIDDANIVSVDLRKGVYAKVWPEAA